ncbi:hypothetical protein LUZ60_009658 [Juncus effusus]|nr:hypothetical protein LUZ60_009658 [Juncus effusus]
MKMAFTEEERAVDESLGYPKAYAKLCKSPSLLCPYSHGPPFAFLPYMLQPQEALKIKDLNEMFPIVDADAVPSVNPKGFVNLLWKQLDHLGNAGFDPALFRVDPFGNVLYLHADSASPLAWDIDHWFPCSRGGKTVLTNLRIMNSQVCKKKGNKLEFLIPWWDLQIGISVNQFLNIFSSKNSDFRNRAFSFLFLDGQNEELNAVQSVESHLFPQYFNEAKNKLGLGLAPAAIVSSRSSDSVLKQVDLNRVPRPTYPVIAAKKFSSEKTLSKENSNPHLSISLARDSLIHQTRAKKKTQAEIEQLDKQISEVRERNEEERESIRDLEELLVRKRRRAEKCRQLAEAQGQYKGLLEKMIRDAMHQSVIYKEQLRLNQSATSTLMARLEAQRAICDSSENELRKKFKQRDGIEFQINSNQARKRSRIDRENDNEFLNEKRDFGNNRFNTSERKNMTKKELRKWLEEEQRNSEIYRGLNRRFSIVDEKLHGGAIENEIEEEEELQNRAIDLESVRDQRRFYIEREDLNEKLETLFIRDEKLKGCEIENEIEEEEEYMSEIGEELQNCAIESKCNRGLRGFSIVERGEPSFIRDEKLHGFAIENEIEEEEEEFIDEIKGRNKMDVNLQNRAINSAKKCEIEEEDYINEMGRENIDKWLQMLANNSEENASNKSSEKTYQNESCNNISRKSIDVRGKEILGFPKSDNTRAFQSLPSSEENYNTSKNSEKMKQNHRNSNVSRKSFDLKEKEILGLQRSDSSRAFRSLPSSPSKIFLGMRKGVDCIGRKPKVLGDDDENLGDYYCNNNRKFGKAIKKALIK